MPKRDTFKRCGRCGQPNAMRAGKCECCGEPLKHPPFRMNAQRIKYIHTLALRTKGLSRDAYELLLEGQGVTTCKDLRRKQYYELIARLKKLPDAKPNTCGRATTAGHAKPVRCSAEARRSGRSSGAVAAKIPTREAA